MEDFELTPEEIKQLFGNHRYDPYWKKINQQLDAEYDQAHKIENPEEWLNYYIHVVEKAVEFYQNKPKLTAINPDFYLSYSKFKTLIYYHEDIKYFYTLYILIRNEGNEAELIVFLSKLLGGLVAMKNNNYKPIDEFTKKRIRKQWWDFHAKKNCKEYFYDDFDSV